MAKHDLATVLRSIDASDPVPLTLRLAVADEIERLRAIVAKLPKTADGVPVVPGMDVWFHFYKNNQPGSATVRSVIARTSVTLCELNGALDREPNELFSTQAAANAAGSE